MGYLTEKQMGYLEDQFFDDNKNTMINLDEASKIYDVSGRDEIIECFSLRILGEYNNGDAIYSFPCKTEEFKSKHGYAAAEKAHENDGLTWYNFSDDFITRKVPGLETPFVEIRYKESNPGNTT